MPTTMIGDHEAYYEIHGAGPGEPVVLLMGLGADLRGWEQQLPALTPHRRVLLLDNRGAGRSGKPPGPYTTALLADDAAAVMDAAGFARAHVVGVSLGGMIAQMLAIRHARKLRSLTLIATLGRSDAQMRETADAGARAGGNVGLATMMAALASGNVQIDPKQAFAFLTPMLFTAEFVRDRKDRLREFFERNMAYGFVPSAFAGQVAAALGHDALAALAGVSAPTMIVSPTADRLIAPRHSRALAQAMPHARLVELEGAAHAVNFEAPERLNELLAGWLAEQDPR